MTYDSPIVYNYDNQFVVDSTEGLVKYGPSILDAEGYGGYFHWNLFIRPILTENYGTYSTASVEANMARFALAGGIKDTISNSSNHDVYVEAYWISAKKDFEARTVEDTIDEVINDTVGGAGSVLTSFLVTNSDIAAAVGAVMASPETDPRGS